MLLQRGQAALEALVNDLGANYASPWGRTALAACATAGHVLLVATLLARGADVDARDADGRSAVWWACHSGQDQTAALLLDCKVTASGADE